MINASRTRPPKNSATRRVPASAGPDFAQLSVNFTIKIPVEHWQPENRGAQFKKFADALGQIGGVDSLEVKSLGQVKGTRLEELCDVCGWQHDAGFTQLRMPDSPVIMLAGVLPVIVRLVHQAHEQGFTALSTKDETLVRTCGGYRNPCKAFDDLRHRDDYHRLFDTGRRGFIAFRGVLGRKRKESEANPE